MLINPLYIHGWGFSSRVFRAFKGIKPDLPGHGRGPQTYKNLDEVARYLAGFLKDHHDIVGWSLGGSLALMVAQLVPERVERIFLIGTTPCFSRAWKESNLRAFKLMISRNGLRSFRRLAGFEDFEDEYDMEILMKMLEDYINLDLREKVKAINKETYIIHGKGDMVVPVEEAYKLHGLMSHSKLFILEGSHLPIGDEEAFVRTIFKVRGNL